jgi:hypothetical protein
LKRHPKTRCQKNNVRHQLGSKLLMLTKMLAVIATALRLVEMQQRWQSADNIQAGWNHSVDCCAATPLTLVAATR